MNILRRVWCFFVGHSWTFYDGTLTDTVSLCLRCGCLHHERHAKLGQVRAVDPERTEATSTKCGVGERASAAKHPFNALGGAK